MPEAAPVTTKVRERARSGFTMPVMVAHRAGPGVADGWFLLKYVGALRFTRPAAAPYRASLDIEARAGHDEAIGETRTARAS
ncbi:hypothetical protein MOKP58_00690 [Mycobacterium avium subsp. hominissuis]